jgi:hypothetical protein
VPLNRKAGEKRLVDMATRLGPWMPDLPGVEPPWTQHFPLSEAAEYVQRLTYDERGRLVEWAVIQNRRIDGLWVCTAVYDICHEKGVHVHLYNRNGVEFHQRSLMPVESYADVEAGVDYALERVAECWEENERRSDRGR